MTTLWNPRKTLNQPPHFGGLSLQAGNAQHLVRATDPLSSVMAAEAAINFAGKHCERILTALKAAGQATPHEMQDATGLTVVQIDRRLPDLQKAGKARVVQANGDDLTRNGYRVWEAV